jgi:hypothetical protein
MKRIAFFISFAALQIALAAQDTITFTWKGSASAKYIQVTATENEPFTVNWGDVSAIDTLIGTGAFQIISHAYADTNNYEVRIIGTANCLLTAFVCIYNQLMDLNLHGNTNMQFLSCQENQLTALNASGCEALVFLRCNNNRLASLDLQASTELQELWCWDNQLMALDLSKNTKLKNLYCASNRLVSLNLNANTALYELGCSDNQLTSLNLNTNTILDFIDCSNNRLTSLDLRANSALEFFYCNNNRLTALDLSTNTVLKELECATNQLTHLDLRTNTALWKTLDCAKNRLTHLDLAANTLLKWLDCSDNQLTELNLTLNTALESLRCSGNPLTNLNLNANTMLWLLECNNNQLTTLNLTANPLLRNLECSNNQLSHLDLSTNTALLYLKCLDNHLQLSDLYNASQKISLPQTKYLGTQLLLPQVIMVGDTIDFSLQKEFGDTATIFTILRRGGYPAYPTDYTITDGVIIFHRTDNYKVIMTNSAIVSHPNYPAQVAAEFTVTTVGTTLSDLSVSEGALTPAFNSTVLNYTVNVDYNTASIIITATPTDPNATISGDTGLQQLAVGATIFYIIVTAADGASELYYTVTENRANEVGIVETHCNASIPKIYPNPTNGTLHVTGYALQENTIIEIYDIYGKNLSPLTFYLSPNQIDISHLANGMYFLKIDNKMYKIVKQ